MSSHVGATAPSLLSCTVAHRSTALMQTCCSVTHAGRHPLQHGPERPRWAIVPEVVAVAGSWPRCAPLRVQSQSSSNPQERGKLSSMRRVPIIIVAIVAAGWVQASAAQPSRGDARGESWGLDSECGQPPIVVDESDLEDFASPQRLVAPWSVGPTAVRFGSGLEDDAPERPANVFHLSGLEELTSLQSTQFRDGGVRFGSGLEDDVPMGPPSALHQSGLEGLASNSSSDERATADRFGSGLEDDAPVRQPNRFQQPGF